ncbi:MAG: hypothetical protein LKM45_05835 [Wolbachia endosymbiont of Alcedoecus sp.]|nr:hypothetical protein [Wolbachia endosymbiont of Alcedoecus sp.]
MLDKISKLCEPIYSTIKDKAKSLYALMVGEPSFDNTTSKPSEKSQKSILSF